MRPNLASIVSHREVFVCLADMADMLRWGGICPPGMYARPPGSSPVHHPGRHPTPPTGRVHVVLGAVPLLTRSRHAMLAQEVPWDVCQATGAHRLTTWPNHLDITEHHLGKAHTARPPAPILGRTTLNVFVVCEEPVCPVSAPLDDGNHHNMLSSSSSSS